MKKIKLIILLILISLTTLISDNKLYVAQEGYAAYEKKYAFLLQAKNNAPAKKFVVINNNGKKILSGKFIFWGYHIDSYYYCADLSSIIKIGTYTLKATGISKQIKIVNRKHFLKLADKVINTYFHAQRCGQEIDDWHNACHLDDSRCVNIKFKANNLPLQILKPTYKAGTHIDVTGGWHDAGDYNKYMGNTPIAIAHLAMAVEEFDFDTALTKSILNEIKWGMDWCLKMQDEDGGVFERVYSGFSAQKGPAEETDNIKNKDDRPLDQDKFTSETGKFIFAAAIASRVLKKTKPQYAKKLVKAAQRAWKWIEDHPEQWPGPWHFGEYPGDISAVIWGALEMYQTTGEKKFLKYAENNYRKIKMTSGADVEHFWWMSQKSICLAKLLIMNDDTDIKNYIENEFNRYIKLLRKKTFANPFLVRTAYEPGWGNNAKVLGVLFDLYWISKSLNQPAVIDEFSQFHNWIYGLNPAGYTFVIGYGNKYPKKVFNHITHHAHKELAGGVVPGLYLRKGKPFYKESKSDFRNNECGIDASAMYLFDCGVVKKHKVIISIKQPLCFETVSGKQKIIFSVLGDNKNLKIEYRIGNKTKFMPVSGSKTSNYTLPFPTQNYPEGRNVIYIRALNNQKRQIAKIYHPVTIDNIDDPPQIRIISPTPGSLTGGGVILEAMVKADKPNIKVMYSLDGINYTSLKQENGRYKTVLKKIGLGMNKLSLVARKKSGIQSVQNINFIFNPSGKIETENTFKVKKDTGGNGIAISDFKYDSQAAVRLGSKGDSLQIPFAISQKGKYILKHRERSGDKSENNQQNRWQNNKYKYTLDHKQIFLNGKQETLTEQPDLYGEYWGTRASKPLMLEAGEHYFTVQTLQDWAYSDYLEIQSLSHSNVSSVKLTPLALLLTDFEKGKLTAGAWGAYAGDNSSINYTIHSLNKKNKTQFTGNFCLKTDYSLKDYIGITYNNNSKNWSDFAGFEFYAKADKTTIIKFNLAEAGSKTFYTAMAFVKNNKWQKVQVNFANFLVATDYQPGNKYDKKLDLNDIAQLHIAPQTQGEGFLFIDNLRLVSQQKLNENYK